MRAYELRCYEIAPEARDTVRTLLTTTLVPLLADHGMQAHGFWSASDGRRLYAVVSHETPGAAAGDWASFVADPRWQQAIASLPDGNPVKPLASESMVGFEGVPPAAAGD